MLAASNFWQPCDNKNNVCKRDFFLLMQKYTAVTYLWIWTKFHHTIKDTGFTAHTRWSPRRAYKKPSEWCTILNSAFSFKEEFCSKTTIFFCIDALLPIFWNLKWWATKNKLDFHWLSKAGVIIYSTFRNGNHFQHLIYWVMETQVEVWESEKCYQNWGDQIFLLCSKFS